MRKGVYRYEYMDDWEKFNETSLPEKEDFYSHLVMENVTDADYAHAKRVYEASEIKSLGKYNDLFVQSDTLLLTDVSENFRNMCLELYELDPAKISSVPGLTWQAAWKRERVKLDVLTDIDMLLIVEKGIRRGICHTIYWYTKANNKCMKDYDKNKKMSYFLFWHVKYFYGWAMLQRLPVNNFEWIEVTFQLNEDFIEKL